MINADPLGQTITPHTRHTLLPAAVSCVLCAGSEPVTFRVVAYNHSANETCPWSVYFSPFLKGIVSCYFNVGLFMLFHLPFHANLDFNVLLIVFI